MSHKRPDWMPRVYDADRFKPVEEPPRFIFEPQYIGICPEPHEVGVEPVFGLVPERHYCDTADRIFHPERYENEPWIPGPEELESVHDERLWTRLLDPEFAYHYKQARIELANELDQEAAWENEGGAHA